MNYSVLNKSRGRVRLRHWGERTLDLDLLIYADAPTFKMNV